MVAIEAMMKNYRTVEITNLALFEEKEFKSALEELIRKHSSAVEDLTEKQFAEAIRQAIACGDFQRLVVTTGEGAQRVLYIPFAEQARLQARIQELEEQCKECTCKHACG